MSASAQVIIAAVSAGLPTLAVLIGILITGQRLTGINQRFISLEARIDQRFDGLRDGILSDILHFEQVMDARLKHLEEHFER